MPDEDLTEEEAKALLRAAILGDWKPEAKPWAGDSPEARLESQRMLDLDDFDREPGAWRRIR